VISVTAQRLDLHALAPGEEVRILTGTNRIQILAADRTGEVSMNLTPTGAGQRWIPEGEIMNRWLRLPSLEPLRMYWLTVHRADPTDRNSTVVQFRDITPGGARKSAKAASRGLFNRRSKRETPGRKLAKG